nr:hypothetical protein [Candidatus Njordarchaeota archaeon]
MRSDCALTSEIKRFLLDQGADLVGIAPVSKLVEWPNETHPQHYMPDSTSVISYAAKILDGVIDVWGDSRYLGKLLVHTFPRLRFAELSDGLDREPSRQRI